MTAPVVDGGFDKALHVSPFMGMDQRYVWRGDRAGPRPLSVHIESREGGERAFDATLALRRAPADRRTLRASSPATRPRRCACWR